MTTKENALQRYRDATDPDAPWNKSLTKYLGLTIADVTGYIIDDFGDLVFKINQIILSDGTEIGVEGEHDLPYIPSKPGGLLSEEVLRYIWDEDEDA